MLWNRWYNLKSYVRSSLWLVPFFALFLHLVFIRVVFALGSLITWVPLQSWSLEGTRTVLNTVVTMTLTFLLFVFASLLVAIQVAGAQLTPRIIAVTLLRDNSIRFTVGLFVFTVLFTTGTLARLEETVPRGVAGIASLLGFACLAAFLYLIDYAARLLRPVSILWRVAEDGRAVIESAYPKLAEEAEPASQLRQLSAPDRVILHGGTSAVVLAVNLDALVAEARKADLVIEFVPGVGDFVGKGEPLLRLFGRSEAIDERRLRSFVALGRERTMEQDVTFAFRIIVDIAIKALSAAINDPTTAVLAIDQLQRLLASVGRRDLLDEEKVDSTGRLRVVFHAPNWEDFVRLSCSEIRHYGAGNFQIARRLRAMIETLSSILPAYRRPALDRELALLDRTIQSFYELPEDLALARAPDSQGLGGRLSS